MVWFFKKKRELSSEVAQQMAQQSLETRRLQHQINQLAKRAEMKQELKVLSESITGDSDDKLLSIVAPILMNMFTGNSSNNQNSTPQPFIGKPPVSSSLDVEKDNQIVNLLNSQIPKKYIEQLQTMTDEDILYIKNKLIEVNL
jgi:hypothetical protein